MAQSNQGITLLGYWASPYALRVKWALKHKGLHEYEYIEEDLPNKSSLLLLYNPVHKKVPVLLHQGKPVAESLVIVEYIDDVWKESPLLPPLDPFLRAKARFWAKFVDDKCVPPIMHAFVANGEEKQKAAKEARDNLKTLEGALEGKQFFGGENIGFVDIAAGWIGVWARIVEQMVGVNLIDHHNIPSLAAWFDRFLQLPNIKECIPPWNDLLDHNTRFHKSLTSAST